MRFWRPESLWLALTVLVVILTIWWIPGSGAIKTDTFSAGFTGKKVFYQTVRQLDWDVSRSNDSLIPVSNTWDRIILLGPARNPSEAEWDALYDEVLGGATLLFAARFRDPITTTGPFGVEVVPFHVQPQNDEKESEHAAEKQAQQQTQPSEAPAEREAARPTNKSNSEESEPADSKHDRSPFDLLKREFPATTDLVDGQPTWKTEGTLQFPAELWEVLLTADSKPQVIRRTLGDGCVVFAASDEIFTNGAMLEPERALLAYRILESTPVLDQTWFDETLNSSGTPKVLGILFDPLFRPLTLQLLLIAVLFGWSGISRFGAREHDDASRRRSVVEHAQALGILYYRAKSGAHAVRCLHEYLKMELRRLYGSTFQVDNLAAVAKLAQVEESELQTLADQTRMIESKPASSANAARLLRRYSMLIASIQTRKDDRRRHPQPEKETHGPESN